MERMAKGQKDATLKGFSTGFGKLFLLPIGFFGVPGIFDPKPLGKNGLSRWAINL